MQVDVNSRLLVEEEVASLPGALRLQLYREVSQHLRDQLMNFTQ